MNEEALAQWGAVAPKTNKQTKPPGHKTGHSHPPTAKVRNGCSHTSAPPLCFHGVEGTFVLSFYYTHTQIRMDCTSLRIMKRQTMFRIWVKKNVRASKGVHLHVLRIHCEPWNLLRKPILSHPVHKNALL